MGVGRQNEYANCQCLSLCEYRTERQRSSVNRKKDTQRTKLRELRSRVLRGDQDISPQPIRGSNRAGVDIGGHGMATSPATSQINTAKRRGWFAIFAFSGLQLVKTGRRRENFVCLIIPIE